MTTRANAEYMRQYRQRNPDRYEAAKRASRAYRRALHELAAAHPRELRRLVNRHRADLGLPPVGVLKPGPKRKEDAA